MLCVSPLHEPGINNYDLRSFERIIEQTEKWMLETGGDLNKRKEYESCQNYPLIADEGLTTDAFGLPICHSKME